MAELMETIEVLNDAGMMKAIREVKRTLRLGESRSCAALTDLFGETYPVLQKD